MNLVNDPIALNRQVRDLERRFGLVRCLALENVPDLWMHIQRVLRGAVLDYFRVDPDFFDDPVTPTVPLLLEPFHQLDTVTALSARRFIDRLHIAYHAASTVLQTAAREFSAIDKTPGLLEIIEAVEHGREDDFFDLLRARMQVLHARDRIQNQAVQNFLLLTEK